MATSASTSTPGALYPIPTAANEAARALLRVGLAAAGRAFEVGMRRRIARYAAEQRRLAHRYGVTRETPIVRYGEEVRRAVEAFAARHADARFAYTSGSTSTPKKIAFTRARLRSIKLGSLSVAARTLVRYGVRRPVLFVLASLKEDDSLSALLLGDARALPLWPVGLVMPAKYLAHPAVGALVGEYGATAARLWLLALSDPGLIYSTNPSTLAVFLGEVHESWEASTRLVRDLVRAPERFPPEIARIARRVAARGAEGRLCAIAGASAGPIPIEEWLPGLECYCCWDGGYVRPFLERIARYLPAPRFRFVPMYSMATETIETLNWFDPHEGGEVRFLAIAPRVLYEFIPEGADDRPENLVAAADLEPGRAYAMVVSDPYGLKRYQTEDLFLCAAKVGAGAGAVPDLRFLRRRGLAYSFTGEKLTGEQIAEAYDALRAEVPALREAGVQMACFPAPASPLPRYRLVLAHPGRAAPDGLDAAAVGARFDRILARVNREFGAKLESGRLGATEAAFMPYDALAARLDASTRDAADVARRAWESQFKLLPLYPRPLDTTA